MRGIGGGIVWLVVNNMQKLAAWEHFKYFSFSGTKCHLTGTSTEICIYSTATTRKDTTSSLFSKEKKNFFLKTLARFVNKVKNSIFFISVDKISQFHHYGC